MAFPKLSDWSDKVYNAGIGNFNLLRDFEKEMHKVYPDTQPYNFGYFSEEDIPSVTTLGWRHLQGSMFDVEDWNSMVGLRFGLTVDASDNIKYGNNYIMLMSRTYREDVILPERKKKNMEADETADDIGAFVHPADPEFNKMKDHARELSSTTKAKVQVKGEPDHGEPTEEKRPRGRPKKT